MEQKVVKLEIGKVLALVIAVVAVALVANAFLQSDYFKGDVTGDPTLDKLIMEKCGEEPVLGADEKIMAEYEKCKKYVTEDYYVSSSLDTSETATTTSTEGTAVLNTSTSDTTTTTSTDGTAVLNTSTSESSTDTVDMDTDSTKTTNISVEEGTVDMNTSTSESSTETVDMNTDSTKTTNTSTEEGTAELNTDSTKISTDETIELNKDILNKR